MLLVGVVAAWLTAGTKTDIRQLVLHTVRNGDLEITVTERGNLESQQNIKIYCEVDDIRGDNIDGNPILWIIPNGTQVEEGELLVEIGSAAHLERVDGQILKTAQARASQIQADVRYQNQISQNQTAAEQAELAVDLAHLQLEMFDDPQNGTSKLEADEIQREIDDTENEILAAKASLKLAENEKNGVEALFKLGYAGKSELDRARLDYLQAQSGLAAKINRLETQLATLSKKTDFEYRMSKMQYKGDENTATRARTQVRLNSEAQLAQAKAALDAANRQLKKEDERLERYKAQLENCKIYAPQSGMVVYASPGRRSSAIAEGALLRERQHILSLPDLSKMQVKTSVHESVQDQVKAGLRATIRLDAFPDRAYEGTVKSVAVLPDQGSWYNSDTKMYETFVTIDETVEQLKPGMTAVCEIHVDRIESVLTVPVQGLQQEDKSTFCYVEVNGRPQRRDIVVGKTNDKFVEVVDGLSAGDRVVLNPMAIVEE